MAKRFPGEDWNFERILPTRTYRSVETGLQKALPSAPWHVLRSTRRTRPDEHDGMAHAQMHCAWTDWGNLQGTVKFYCLTTGRVLKRREFTAMPMPDRIIKRVNTIGQREKQGRDFRFLDRRKEPYEWTDSVPEDDPEFQGLLEDEEEAIYPDVSAELPGVVLEEEERDCTPVTDEPEPDFRDLAGAALHNAGIDADQRIRAALAAGDAAPAGPALVEADEDEIV